MYYRIFFKLTSTYVETEEDNTRQSHTWYGPRSFTTFCFCSRLCGSCTRRLTKSFFTFAFHSLLVGSFTRCPLTALDYTHEKCKSSKHMECKRSITDTLLRHPIHSQLDVGVWLECLRRVSFSLPLLRLHTLVGTPSFLPLAFFFLPSFDWTGGNWSHSFFLATFAAQRRRFFILGSFLPFSVSLCVS